MPEPSPYLWLMDPDPGGTKTCGTGSYAGAGSLTLPPNQGCEHNHKSLFTGEEWASLSLQRDADWWQEKVPLLPRHT